MPRNIPLTQRLAYLVTKNGDVVTVRENRTFAAMPQWFKRRVKRLQRRKFLGRLDAIALVVEQG